MLAPVARCAKPHHIERSGVINVMLVQGAFLSRAAAAVLAAILSRDYAEDDGPVRGPTCETLLTLFGRKGFAC
jgi:hypothetical protein